MAYLTSYDQERCRQGQAQRQESQECREALTRLPGSIHQRQPLDAAAEEPEADLGLAEDCRLPAGEPDIQREEELSAAACAAAN
jgi:hypothetical protein